MGVGKVHLSMKYLKLSCIYGLLATALSTAVFAQEPGPLLNSKDSIDALATSSLTPAPPMPLLDPSPKHVIVIDPGHGGIDPGAVSQNGTKEKDVVLAYAKALKQSLEGSGRYEVLLTRSSDKLLKLDDRVEYARAHKAELFIAVHADMLDNRSVRGTTVYTVSDQASDFEADALAKKENGANQIAGLNLSNQKQNVANALVTLAQRESQSEALLFAQKTVHEITLNAIAQQSTALCCLRGFESTRCSISFSGTGLSLEHRGRNPLDFSPMAQRHGPGDEQSCG